MTYASGQKGNGLVDTAEGRDIDGLTTDSTSRTDTSGVFTGTGVDDSINENLDGVLVGQQVNDLESMLDNAGSHQLLAVVATVHHERIGQTFDNGALKITIRRVSFLLFRHSRVLAIVAHLSLAETLDSEATGGVGQVGVLTDLNVVLERNVLDLNIFVGPLVEKLARAVGAGKNVSG